MLVSILKLCRPEAEPMTVLFSVHTEVQGTFVDFFFNYLKPAFCEKFRIHLTDYKNNSN